MPDMAGPAQGGAGAPLGIRPCSWRVTVGLCTSSRCGRSRRAHLARQVGFSAKRARTGAVTLIQRFRSALNLNLHFHMLFLDAV